MNFESSEIYSYSLDQYSQFFPRLSEIADAPKTLFIHGDPSIMDSETIFLTVVGSRKISQYGKEACKYLLEGLQGENVTIVSGLALGTDSHAHKMALELGLNTIVFPGSGLSEKVLYPATNRHIARDIVRAGGLLVSEFTPDTKPQKWMFPKRNRLMAGLSHAVLIIEAGEKSGTLITAYQAIDYNRDVLVVPGSIFNPNTIGAHQLLEQGAVPIYSQDSLRSHLGFEKTEASTKNKPENLTPIQLQLFESLTAAPKTAHELSIETSTPIHEIQVELTLLEIDNHIYQDEQARFVAKI